MANWFYVNSLLTERDACLTLQLRRSQTNGVFLTQKGFCILKDFQCTRPSQWDHSKMLCSIRETTNPCLISEIRCVILTWYPAASGPRSIAKFHSLALTVGRRWDGGGGIQGCPSPLMGMYSSERRPEIEIAGSKGGDAISEWTRCLDAFTQPIELNFQFSIDCDFAITEM